MASKQVTDREKSTRAVVASADTHATEINAGLTRELGPYLKAGEAMPDVALLVRLFGRKVKADNAALVAADHAHEKELSDDAAPREARDKASGEARGVLLDLRAAVEAVYGAAGLTLLGIAAAVPTDASAVAAYGANALKALEDASIKLPKPRRSAMKVDRAAFADDLRAELPPLQKALDKVAVEDREKEATQRAKNDAMAKNDATFTNAANWLSASCAAAGLSELADKVRPSGRRPGRQKIEDEAEEGAGEATPTAEGGGK